MKMVLSGFYLIIMLTLGGCSSTPPEAPELSTHLGTRISALEMAHLRLLHNFFEEKKNQVDRFIQEDWVPSFAENYFKKPRASAMWNKVVASNDPSDRLKYITLLGPKIITEIYKKRVALITPLEEIEASIQAKIKSEYAQTRAINNTLTAFLYESSKLDQNRKRYLEMMGITDTKIDSFINKTDQIVSDLLTNASSTETRITNINKYLENMKSMKNELNK